MELIEVDGYELFDLVLGPHGRLDHRALGIGDIERHPNGRQRREYIREQDDAVGREGAPGLQSDLDDEVRLLGPVPERGMALGQRLVLRHVPPRLPHHPCRWAREAVLAPRRAHKQRLLWARDAVGGSDAQIRAEMAGGEEGEQLGLPDEADGERDAEMEWRWLRLRRLQEEEEAGAAERKATAGAVEEAAGDIMVEAAGDVAAMAKVDLRLISFGFGSKWTVSVDWAEVRRR